MLFCVPMSVVTLGLPILRQCFCAGMTHHLELPCGICLPVLGYTASERHCGVRSLISAHLSLVAHAYAASLRCKNCF